MRLKPADCALQVLDVVAQLCSRLLALAPEHNDSDRQTYEDNKIHVRDWRELYGLSTARPQTYFRYGAGQFEE
jgi:hypothetical protein